MKPPVRLRDYDNSWYDPGRSIAWRTLWLLVGQPLFRSPFLPSSKLRVSLLRLFGARLGHGVVIHSEVLVKYPWHLVVGDDCWIGERVWIDCLTAVHLGNDVCISQGAYLCTGNHDWSDPAFGLRVEPIQLDDAAWVGAQSILLPGAHLSAGAVLAAGSVTGGVIPPCQIYSGNPARFVRQRIIRETATHDRLHEVAS
jgi:putative colanic acid biosynthesis acetyltransferase WcaF